MKVLMIVLFFAYCNILQDLPVVGQYFGNDDEKKQKERNNLLLIIGAAVVSQSNGQKSCDGTDGFPKNKKNEVNTILGNSTFYTGIAQVTSNNQDAYVYKTTSSRLDWCYYYDVSLADTRGVIIKSNSTNIFVVFTTDGGNASFKASTDAIQTSYGVGGGPKVTFLARLDTNGNQLNATYLGARLDDGKVNTLNPTDIQVTETNVTFIGQTAYDGGKAKDSLDLGKVCASGSTRTIVMPVTLNRKDSVSCN